MKTYSHDVALVQGKGDAKEGMKKLGGEKGKVEIADPTQKVVEKKIDNGVESPKDGKK